ncbi:hypothetical protein HJG60_007857 [Phyllostomus discolor]|uniref:Uncharacterized protein n=1 Tax=Phyllostomus discolor TaxID=89673 RepID=A0A834BND3_9CHIR|nr:hypothetical protein HJG60_007857 [Phyllostomus discolor]
MERERVEQRCERETLISHRPQPSICTLGQHTSCVARPAPCPQVPRVGLQADTGVRLSLPKEQGRQKEPRQKAHLQDGRCRPVLPLSNPTQCVRRSLFFLPENMPIKHQVLSYKMTVQEGRRKSNS